MWSVDLDKQFNEIFNELKKKPVSPPVTVEVSKKRPVVSGTVKYQPSRFKPGGKQ